MFDRNVILGYNIIRVGDVFMNDKLEIMKNKKGFIAALDQSGGSSKKTLSLYGVSESSYETEDEMFSLIHDMRSRIMTDKEFTSEKIIGVILFYQTMTRKINSEYTPTYLWNNKKMLSFLKIDKGLEEQQNGVKLMKEIDNLDEVLTDAKKYGVFGTKMRSVIYEYNEVGIKKIVEQQFSYAKRICEYGLVPIIEPEVDINSKDKKEIEILLKREIDYQLSLLNDEKIMFKFTLPEEDDFYIDYTKNKNVIRVVALSGGYNKNIACDKLKNNHNVIASFSRALLEGLNINLSDEEFSSVLKESVDMIYKASIT